MDKDILVSQKSPDFSCLIYDNMYYWKIELFDVN